MNEADRIKLELKRKRNKDLMFYIILIIFVAIVLCIVIVSFENRYKPDPSLYVEYDLSKDTILPPYQNIIPVEKREKEIWEVRGVTMEVTKIATYDITGKVEAIKDFGTNMIANMGKEGKHISMDTLTKICEALECEITDVIELVHDEKEEDSF